MKIAENARLYFAGICGVGMSALAQFFASHGFDTAGSDRALKAPENKDPVKALKSYGIKLFPQDGSFRKKFTPDYVICSTAVEEDNPDLVAATGIKRLHRSQALAVALELNKSQKSVAVAGSCGKTSVSAWLTETLWHMDMDPSLLCGGLVNSFRDAKNCGNYRAGNGPFFIFEADESDKSLLNYNPDYALILNIGTDHYPKDELLRVFNEFAAKVKTGAVIEYELFKQMAPESLKHLKIKTFSTSDPNADFHLSEFTTGILARTCVNKRYELSLTTQAIHHAANAMAVLAFADLCGLDIDKAAAATGDFKGVWRRFDFAGVNHAGASIYDDYAHNVEKIISCIQAGRELKGEHGRIIAVFQPHGFGPLEFMREELFKALEQQLADRDYFLMLEPYYAGGTTSFKPTSAEVVSQWRSRGKKNYAVFADRKKLKRFLTANSKYSDVILIMGARDNSLSEYARSVARSIN